MPATAYDEQYLPTGDGHTLYVAQYGKPDGIPAVVLHGGPGSSAQPSMLDWFDLDRQRVVLFDQRGAGLSAPQGEIRNNDSTKLVADIDMIRRHLRIGRWMVVGGSWGATLALLYAQQHAAQMTALVLRGSFLASAREMTWFFQSLQAMVPAGWQRMTEGWHADEKSTVLTTLSHALLNGSDEKASEAARRWSGYEDAVVQAMAGTQPNYEAAPDEATLTARVLNKYRVQAHYLSQGCFTTEAALLESAGKLQDVPVIMIHGTHDLICPPENALMLKKAMPHAALRWIGKAGHLSTDAAIAQALKEAVAELAV
jgi:proline iminopeptidase